MNNERDLLLARAEAEIRYLRTKRTSTFWYGCFAQAFAMSLLQDLYGKAKYMAMVDAGWIDWKITVPLAAIGFSYCLWKAGRKW